MKREIDENHKHHAREMFFIFLAVLGSLFLLVQSPGNLNNFTGASTVNSITSFTESNYFLGIMLFLLTLIFALYILSLVRRSRNQIWHPEPLGEDEVSIATWDTELPLDEKIHQINKELKNLMKDTPQMIRKISKKITRMPNIKEVKLKEELEKIQNKIQGYSKPTILEAPKKKIELEKDLLNIRSQLKGLEQMKFRKVKVREEAPSKESLIRIFEKRESLKKELDELHVKMHGSSVNKQKKKEEISQDVMEINRKIAELEKMPVKKVMMRTKVPKRKSFTDMPDRKRLQKELSKLNSMDGKSDKDKKKEQPKKKSKALQEIEEKLAKLEEEN